LRKFLALYVNEMIKISRKIVVIIILAIMIVGVISFGGLMKIQQASITNQTGNIDNATWAKEEMKNRLADFKLQLADIEQKISSAKTEEEKSMFQLEKINIMQQVELYQLAVDMDINLNGNGFKSKVLNDLAAQKSQMQQIELIPADRRTKEQDISFSQNKRKIADYEAILKTGDFAKYIEIKNQEIDKDDTLTSDEKKLKKETNLLWLKLDPKGEAGNDGNGILESTLGQIENYKRSLLNNIDYTSQTQFLKPLTPAGRKDVENNLAILLYKAENQMIETNFNSASQIQEAAISGMFGFGIFMMVCMMLILAGGAISQEMSTGSIKSLIISPTKRYKIFLAKLASLVTVGIFSALVLYVVSMITNGLFFGFDSGASYVFAINGVAQQLNFYMYRFAFLFVNFIDVIVYTMLAYMLSIITRNTAASVGISIAVYFGGSLANTFLSLMAKGEWLKFIPFNNLSLAPRIFPDPSAANVGIGSIFGYTAVVPSTLFSGIYLAVLVICMGYIALDSFNRRDIK